MTEYEETMGADYDVHELEVAVSAVIERYRIGAGDELRADGDRILRAATDLWNLVELLGLRRAA